MKGLHLTCCITLNFKGVLAAPFLTTHTLHNLLPSRTKRQRTTIPNNWTTLTSIKFELKKIYLRPLVTHENWGGPRYRAVVAKSIEISAIFELDAAWSFYYVHCTFCIVLKLAPTTLKFKRSDVKIEYNKQKIDFPIRRTNKSASLLYWFYKVIIGLYLNRHESLALPKR